MDRARASETAVRAGSLHHACRRVGRAAQRRQPDCHARSRGRRVPQPRDLPGGHRKRAPGFPDAYTEGWPPRGQRRLFVSRRPGAKPRVSTPVQRNQYLPCRRKPGFEPLVLTKGTVLFASIIIDLRLSPRREEETLSRKGGPESSSPSSTSGESSTTLKATSPPSPAEPMVRILFPPAGSPGRTRSCEGPRVRIPSAPPASPFSPVPGGTTR